MAVPLHTTIADAKQMDMRRRAEQSPENVEAYLKEYEPHFALFRWEGARSFMVPFDKIMWKVRAAQQYADRQEHAHAARVLRTALVQDFPVWTHRGSEAAQLLAEPNVYAIYCRERGKAALAICKNIQEPNDAVPHLASYAALMLGTAYRFRPKQESEAPVYEALGISYASMGHLLLKQNRVGEAVGAMQRAQACMDRAALGTTCDLQGAIARNAILGQSIVVPKLANPHIAGGLD